MYFMKDERLSAIFPAVDIFTGLASLFLLENQTDDILHILEKVNI